METNKWKHELTGRIAQVDRKIPEANRYGLEGTVHTKSWMQKTLVSPA